MGSYRDDLNCAACCDGEESLSDKYVDRSLNTPIKYEAGDCHHCYRYRNRPLHKCPWCGNEFKRLGGTEHGLDVPNVTVENK